MFIQTFPSGPFSTNAYIVGCEATRQAAIIDPAPGSTKAIISYLEHHQFTAQQILLTHSHWDHIGDVSELKQKLNLHVYIHPLDAPNLQEPGSDLLPCWISIPAVKPDFFLKEDEIISVGRLVFQVIYTPGHSPGGVCFYCAEQAVLFSGDTLFKGTIGNLSFPTCNADLMWTSLDKLAKLPAQTKVYPGHGPQTTIGAEHWLPHARELFS